MNSNRNVPEPPPVSQRTEEDMRAADRAYVRGMKLARHTPADKVRMQEEWALEAAAAEAASEASHLIRQALDAGRAEFEKEMADAFRSDFAAALR